MEPFNTLVVAPLALRLTNICHMSRVCDLLNMRSGLVKFEFIVKFNPSLLIVLFDDASYASMLKRNDVYCQVYVLQLNDYHLTSSNLNL